MASMPSSPITPSQEAHSLSVDSTATSPTSPSKPFPQSSHTRCFLITTALVVIAALLIGLLTGLLTRSSSPSPSSPSPPSTYRAVAVQYLPYSTPSNPSTLLALNLQSYASIVSSLSPSSPDLIVFPEGGLGYLVADESSPTNATATRLTLLPFCEVIPHPSTPAIPCVSLNSTTNPQLTALSCLARTYTTSLVVNLCQIEHCTPGSTPTPTSTPYPFASTPCPSDGLYYWSSNVVLDSTGAVIAVYAKSHLFDTLSFNTPTPTAVTWTMGAVTFGTLVAFDIEFTQPGRALLEGGVQHFVWTGWWATNQPPQLTSVMVQQGWAERWGVNLIAANALNNVGYGGGVYSAGTLSNIAFDPSFIAQPGDWRVVVQDLPVVLPASPQPLVSPTRLGSAGVIGVSGGVPCVISAIGEVGNCTFLTAVGVQTVTTQHGDVTCTATAITSNLSAPLTQYALYASQNSYYAPDTPSSLYLESCHLLYCPSSAPSASPIPCDLQSYAAPIPFTSVTLMGGLNCSRFAPTAADGGRGEEGQGPAGTVLPMMAVGQGVVMTGMAYEWGYAGKAGSQCWWNITTLQPTGQGLFSIGFYGTDGQADSTS